MTTQERKIQCPNCGASISIDEVLTKQIEGTIKERVLADQKLREAELAKKEEKLKEQEETLALNKKDLDSIVKTKVAEQLSEEKLILLGLLKSEIIFH